MQLVEEKGFFAKFLENSLKNREFFHDFAVLSYTIKDFTV